jgi:fumarate hydratase subunit beta
LRIEEGNPGKKSHSKDTKGKNMDKYITTPLTAQKVEELHAGDYVYITGIIYSARDAAHQRMYEAMQQGETIPMDIREQVIYYLGPTPEREGQVIGSAGPTTSSRMDKYTPLLLEQGLKGMIGKGLRNKEVIESMIKNKAVYFAAVGGAGALLSKRIKASRVIAYDDLGTEAIRELYVEDFPVIVVIDCNGNNLYDMI